MKLTELRCPSCGGPLTVNEKNSLIAECEYCKKYIALEWENNQPYVNQKAGYRVTEEMLYEQRRNRETADRQRKFFLILAASFFVMFLVVPMIFTLFESGDSNDAKETLQEQAENAGFNVEEEIQQVELSGNLGELASQVFNIQIQDISVQELSQIKWLEIKYVDEQRMIGYSFDSPEAENAELTWLSFSEDSEFEQECLSLFTGLERLSVQGSIGEEDLKGLSLSSIEGYFYSPQQVAGLVEDVSSIKELQFLGSVETLEGLEQFTNLESLSIGSSDLTEVDALRNLPNLKKLKLTNFDELTDFSYFGTMDQLEELSLDSENLKALNFLSGMKNLKRLEIADAQILSLDGVEDRPELESLTVTSCDELKSMDAVQQLTNLKELSLELPYGCAEPYLGNLTGLEHLVLSDFDNCSGLESLRQLESLELDSCSFSRAPDLSGLTNLKELNYHSFAGSGLSLSFITRIPALEKLDMGGVSTYEDISGIFNMKSLKELDIDGMECELAFDRIEDNQTLESLCMDGIVLYKNVQVYRDGAITYVDWDDVVLDEHTEFLRHFKGLKSLSIQENQLTDISFVTDMAMLETIDLTDNYITEIRPLAELKNLKQVVCTGNPVSNKNVLGDKVAVTLE